MGVWDQLTGKETNNIIEEYSEVYGEVLYGIHREVKKLEFEVEKYKNFNQEVDKLGDLVQIIDSKYPEIEDCIDKVAQLSRKILIHKKHINEIKTNIQEEQQSKIDLLNQFHKQEKINSEVENNLVIISKKMNEIEITLEQYSSTIISKQVQLSESLEKLETTYEANYKLQQNQIKSVLHKLMLLKDQASKELENEKYTRKKQIEDLARQMEEREKRHTNKLRKISYSFFAMAIILIAWNVCLTIY
ncbi:coiled-coil domain-containing protein [Metabacillus schmidteae]|uniref:hypothetical protein n=1 Tax=Metabacillus schmidteae TaxID=2730405 RepID=UPI00158D3737|nr:hypothetical protein [Metabacillus schmidteae]